MALLLPAAAGCATTERIPLRILYAGSLIVPFTKIEQSFEQANPGIDLQMEGHGSIQVVRQVTDVHQKIDVIVTADESLIPMLMYQANDPDTGKAYADWFIRFATNEMAIAYTSASKYANEITAENWFSILSRPDVKVGISDPRFDANGYRALMMLKLAESHYENPSIFASVLDGQFDPPITAAEEESRMVIRVPEIVQTSPQAHMIVRGYSVQLLSLLQAGELDYAFEYVSVIRQHSLQVLRLPPQVNLADPRYQEAYRRMVVQSDFQRFASVKPEFRGEVIGYGLTIPENASHPEQAAQFIAYLLGPEGRRGLEDNFQPTIAPPLADQWDRVPPSLQRLCQPLP